MRGHLMVARIHHLANSPPRYHPAECSLTISGEKNGKYVEYTFDVPESEYVMYNVGDHYPKRQEN